MNEKRGKNNKDHPGELGSSANSLTSLKKPPLYNCLSLVVVGFCVAGITWLLRSGALQLFDRHPMPGENYEYGWFVSLLFAVPGGFLIGSYLMFQILMWYQRRAPKDKE